MKKIISLFLAILLLCLALPAYAAEPLPNGAIRVVVNEKELTAIGVVVDGRTLVPMRALAEAMGAEVEWRAADQTVIVKKLLYKTDEIGRIESFNRSVYFVIGRKSAMVSGEESQMDVAPQIIGGQTMLPAKYLAGYLEADVAWDDASRTVTITSGLSSTPQGAKWADENQAMAVDQAMSDYLKEVNEKYEKERLATEEAQLKEGLERGTLKAYGYYEGLIMPIPIEGNPVISVGIGCYDDSSKMKLNEVDFKLEITHRETKQVVKTIAFKYDDYYDSYSELTGEFIGRYYIDIMLPVDREYANEKTYSYEVLLSLD